MLSSEKTYSIAKGTRSPRLTLTGSYGTGYSSARQGPSSLLAVTYDPTLFITESGESVLGPTYDLETISFNDQFADNANQAVGINLTIPIFNGWASRTGISKARIGVELSRYNLELTQNQLRKNVQQAYADAVAALKKYRASEKAEKALSESFGYSNQRFNVGMITAVEYNDAKNKLTKAKSDVLQAKYEFTFKTKILDFYQGKSLAF